MKKLLLIAAILLVLSAVPALAMLDSDTVDFNITINTPVTDDYRSGTAANYVLNATIAWAGAERVRNVSNATFIFELGTNTTQYINDTINGSRTTALSGDFRFNLSDSNFTSGSYTVYVMAWNATSQPFSDATTINSSKKTLVYDRTGGSVVISEPYSGSTVVPNNNVVSFNYLPTEANLGNCSLNINNQLVKSSTSGTISPNVTSGINNRFTHEFSSENLSVRLAIRCIDLAGNPTSSSSLNNFTFNVLVGALSPAIRQAQIAAMGGGGGGGFAQQQQVQEASAAFLAVSQSAAVQQASTHLQKWAWAYVIGGFLIAGLIIRKYWK